MDYLALNQKIYDQIAEEFKQKITVRKSGDKKIVNKLSHYLKNISGAKILDTGPGNGQMAKMLCDKGFKVVGIEFSKPMAKIAKNTAPKMKLIVDNFITHDFGIEKFSGILSIAFIHLFTKVDCQFVLNKIYSLLNNDGFALISTTKHAASEEGLSRKENFKNKPLRFRKKLTKDELNAMLENAKFNIIEYYENRDTENNDKTWMNFVVKE